MNNYEKYIEAKKKQYMDFWRYLDYRKKEKDEKEFNETEKEEYERLKKVFIY